MVEEVLDVVFGFPAAVDDPGAALADCVAGDSLGAGCWAVESYSLRFSEFRARI